MVKIYSYRKVSDDYTTHSVAGEDITELCTIDGITYICAGGILPPHSDLLTVAEVTLTPEIVQSIKTCSPHVALISERIRAKIRERYDAESEMYFARISIGAITGQYVMEPGEAELVAEYGAYIESVRQWGRGEKTLLGLQ